MAEVKEKSIKIFAIGRKIKEPGRFSGTGGPLATEQIVADRRLVFVVAIPASRS